MNSFAEFVDTIAENEPSPKLQGMARAGMLGDLGGIGRKIRDVVTLTLKIANSPDRCKYLQVM